MRNGVWAEDDPENGGLHQVERVARVDDPATKISDFNLRALDLCVCLYHNRVVPSRTPHEASKVWRFLPVGRIVVRRLHCGPRTGPWMSLWPCCCCRSSVTDSRVRVRLKRLRCGLESTTVL